MDIFFLGGAAVLFVLSIGLIHLCEKLRSK